jgi:hypothetical protein
MTVYSSLEQIRVIQVWTLQKSNGGHRVKWGTILKCVLNADFAAIKRDPVPSSYEMCNGVSGSMKGAEIVDELGYTLKLA